MNPGGIKGEEFPPDKEPIFLFVLDTRFLSARFFRSAGTDQKSVKLEIAANRRPYNGQNSRGDAIYAGDPD
ncbi:MAG: hypothetical protein RLZZ399_41 [Verrucomicrobiota bacterium]|jgi:hypothetical protein